MSEDFVFHVFLNVLPLSGNILFGIPCDFDKFHSNVPSQCVFPNFQDVCNDCNIDKYNLLCDFEFDGF